MQTTKDIRKRILGKTNLSVSEMGFGAWAIGGAWGERVPENQAKTALHAAIDAGVNFIDTADVYGAGRSERIIGSVLKERSESIHVATKMGRGSDWSDAYPDMERAVVAAIERLGVEALDLVQLHCIPTESLKKGQVFLHLEKLREKGLINHYGASVETVEEGVFCIENSGAATLQIIFNLFRQKPIAELFPLATEKNVGIIARVPLASGLLSGKFSPEHAFHPEDHRHFNAHGEMFNVGETFAGVEFVHGVALANQLRSLLSGESPEATLAQKALRWILDHEAVSVVIPGMKNAAQVDENIAACFLDPLTQESHTQLAHFYRSEIHERIRGVY